MVYFFSEQQMSWLYVTVVIAQGERLGIAQGFLKFGGEFVLAHENVLACECRIKS